MNSHGLLIFPFTGLNRRASIAGRHGGYGKNVATAVLDNDVLNGIDGDYDELHGGAGTDTLNGDTIDLLEQ